MFLQSFILHKKVVLGQLCPIFIEVTVKTSKTYMANLHSAQFYNTP